MSLVELNTLTTYAKQFSGLTPEYETLREELGPVLKPMLGEVIDAFYDTPGTIDKTAPVLEGRLKSLKGTHKAWVESLFTGLYDHDYTAKMFHVGDVHVKVNLAKAYTN